MTLAADSRAHAGPDRGAGTVGSLKEMHRAAPGKRALETIVATGAQPGTGSSKQRQNHARRCATDLTGDARSGVNYVWR